MRGESLRKNNMAFRLCSEILQLCCEIRRYNQQSTYAVESQTDIFQFFSHFSAHCISILCKMWEYILDMTFIEVIVR